MSAGAPIKIVDTTVRDGSHSVAHQFTPGQVATVAGALDDAGVWAVAVGHGDGLGAGSRQYGFAGSPDADLISAAAEVMSKSLIATALLPGVGTKEDLRAANDAGASVVRRLDRLHRGRHRDPAPRPRPRARDEGPQPPQHGAYRDSGDLRRERSDRRRCRRRSRLPRRLSRSASARQRPRQCRGAPIRAPGRGRDRHPRAQQPLARGRQQRRRDRRGGDDRRRHPGRDGRRRRELPGRAADRGARQARLRDGRRPDAGCRTSPTTSSAPS